MASPHLNRQLIDGFPFFRSEGQPVLELSAHTGQLVHQLLDKIKAECTAQRPDHELLVRLHLLEIFVLINREYSTSGSAPHEALSRGQLISRQFKELVSQHFLHKKQVQDYADLLCITPRHLTEMVSASTGRAPSHWILTMEMLEAKYQLKYSTRPITDIAAYLGYPDPAYFSKVFRKAAGCSPQQYRHG